MPDQISVSEFVAETLEDYMAPTASSFTTRTAQCRNTVAAIEEILCLMLQGRRVAKTTNFAQTG
ncbi:arf-GAP with SH3 domain, ANK repeat and PH domain-containing protein 2 isoform X2 [Mus musculus]|uniref:arf-GAP with SH3 domain, ANK repeat and PH domain-containing protein 2 isoform X2 n=1 Tax=Mus musculus TaxID=10090 RepID=UPI0024154767|nr:arf-GAP with SH3 domain, ANK repeat and PH domain-containing protein 2 isoform X2 [Mus musculus]